MILLSKLPSQESGICLAAESSGGGEAAVHPVSSACDWTGWARSSRCRRFLRVAGPAHLRRRLCRQSTFLATRRGNIRVEQLPQAGTRQAKCFRQIRLILRWHLGPLRAAAENPQHAVQNRPRVVPRTTTIILTPCRAQDRFHQFPLFVCQFPTACHPSPQRRLEQLQLLRNQHQKCL